MLLNISIIVTFISILLLCFTPEKLTASFGAMAIALNSIFLSIFVVPTILGNPIGFSVNADTFPRGISVFIDGLSAWFILIVNITFGVGYLKAQDESGNNPTLHWKQFEKIDPREIFPKKRTYLMKSVDVFEYRVLNPIHNQLVSLTSQFCQFKTGEFNRKSSMAFCLSSPYLY